MDNKKGDIKLKYGLRDDKIVYIGDLTKEEKGLDCNCVCPNCKVPLVAKLGDRKQHHFAHDRDSNCKIEYAQQTALHLMAKEIIEEEKEVLFPEFRIYPENVGIWDRYDRLAHYSCTKNIIVHFDSVELEKEIPDINIIPDVIVKKGEDVCLIEIKVTHSVDEEKKRKVDKRGLPMLEIDLSDYRDVLDKKILADILKNNINNKKWISNPRVFEKHKEIARNHFQEKIEKIKQKQEALEREWKEEEKRKQKKLEFLQRKNAEAKQNIQNAFQPEIYTNIIKSLRNDEKVRLEYQKTKMYKNEKNKEIPFYFDIPIKEEIVFNCDRRIWQMILFEKFIYYRNKDEKIIFLKNKHIKNYFVKYVNNEKGYALINKDYYSTDHTNGDNLLWIVIDKYLKKLHNLGFLDYADLVHQGVVKTIYNIVPPDIQYAELLKQAMSEVDCFSIDAGEKIDLYITQRLKQ